MDFRDLECWKNGRIFKNEIKDLVKTFPSHETYKLIDQITRSARSITANIAEGDGRYHYQENIQYCRIARGSINETMNHLIDAFDEEYIDEQTLNKLLEKAVTIRQILNGYIAYLQKRKKE
jgi:four helix bundle protein